eukprot:m.212323 g.212323  ORF g.212323 m.212323 type:complete len:260 (+) comp26154_c0_seq16:633-1412(+)
MSTPTDQGYPQEYAKEHQSVRECIEKPATPNAVIASDLPDAFYFSTFIEGSNCSGSDLADLHNVNFAGFLVQTAGNDSLLGPFARAYGSHIMTDTIGFSPQGFLGWFNGNWLQMWPFMATLDGVIGKQQLKFPQDSVLFNTIGETEAQFFAQTTALFTGVPSLTTQQVLECSAAWSKQIKASALLSQSKSQATLEDELALWSPYPGGFANQTLLAEKQASCAADLTQFWWKALETMDPYHAGKAAQTKARELFEEGLCG